MKLYKHILLCIILITIINIIFKIWINHFLFETKISILVFCPILIGLYYINIYQKFEKVNDYITKFSDFSLSVKSVNNFSLINNEIKVIIYNNYYNDIIYPNISFKNKKVYKSFFKDIKSLNDLIIKLSLLNNTFFIENKSKIDINIINKIIHKKRILKLNKVL